MPAQSDALAGVYATSLYELADAAGGDEKILEIADELEQLSELMRSDKKLNEFLSSPIIDEEKRGESLRRIFQNRVTDLLLRFLLVLNDKGRLNYLESIFAGYDQLVQARFGRVEVNVYTPAPLGDAQRSAIAEKIRNALGKEPVIHPYTEPSMIGGIKLKIGDRLIDGSVAGQLRRMKETLLNEGRDELRQRIERVIEGGGS